MGSLPSPLLFLPLQLRSPPHPLPTLRTVFQVLLPLLAFSTLSTFLRRLTMRPHFVTVRHVTHGRVAMLAVIGFLVGEKVEGSSFLFDSQISGPAISHFFQVPNPFWEILVLAIGGLELNRAQVAFVS